MRRGCYRKRACGSTQEGVEPSNTKRKGPPGSSWRPPAIDGMCTRPPPPFALTLDHHRAKVARKWTLGRGRPCASINGRRQRSRVRKQASSNNARGGGGTGMDMLARAGRPCALLRAPRGRHWPDTRRYHCFGWVCGGGGPWVDGAGLRTRSNRTTTHCTASSSSTTTGIDRRRAPCSHPAPHPAHLPTQPAHTTRTGTQDQGP